MTDWTPEEEEAFNDVEKRSNLGKQILRDMANKSSGMDCCTYDCIQGRNCPIRKQMKENNDKNLRNDETVRTRWFNPSRDA